jgi:hypothetical protein
MFYLSDHPTLFNGTPGRGQPKKDLAQLRTWQNQAAEVTVTNPEGTARKMVFSPGELEVEAVGGEPSRRKEWYVSALLTEV